MEKVSVIIPVYNSENYLKDCLDSVLLQTYDNFEIIIVNDGSIDNSSNICHHYANKSNKIKIYDKQNGGAASAKNLGISKATGKYICFVDSDDTIEVDYIKYLYNLITSGDYNMAIARYKVQSGKKIHKSREDHSLKKLTSKECLKMLLLSKEISVSLCAKIYKTSFLKKYKLAEGYPYEDDEIIYRLIMNSDEIPYGNKIIYTYYVRNNSVMTKKFTEKKLVLLQYAENMKKNILLKYPDLNNDVQVKYTEYQLSILRQLVCTRLNDSQKILKKELKKELLKKRKRIVFSKNYSIRDKIALLSLSIGEGFYSFSWKVYCYIKY